MNAIACLVALALFVAAESYVVGPAYRGLHYYYGSYPGDCANGHDGMYINGPYSFVVCTNGNAYEQACAEGSANGPSQGYHVGQYYNNGDFCNVNLNDLKNPHGNYYGNYYPYGYNYGYYGGYRRW